MRAFSEAVANRANYRARIQTRAHFLAPDSRDMVGEFYAGQVHCAFSDVHGMMLIVESDNGRHYQQVYFSEPTNDKTDWPLDGQRIFRHTFDLVAREGLLGQFFTITAEKIIDDSGVFDHFGTDLEIIPCPEYTPEFESGLGALARSY
jgi:hypothetical protein